MGVEAFCYVLGFDAELTFAKWNNKPTHHVLICGCLSHSLFLSDSLSLSLSLTHSLSCQLTHSCSLSPSHKHFLSLVLKITDKESLLSVFLNAHCAVMFYVCCLQPCTFFFTIETLCLYLFFLSMCHSQNLTYFFLLILKLMGNVHFLLSLALRVFWEYFLSISLSFFFFLSLSLFSFLSLFHFHPFLQLLALSLFLTTSESLSLSLFFFLSRSVSFSLPFSSLSLP